MAAVLLDEIGWETIIRVGMEGAGAGERQVRRQLHLADWRWSAWAGKDGGGKGGGKAEGAFRPSGWPPTSLKHSPTHYSHIQVDSELPVRPGDQLQLMLVEAKQGGDAGPLCFAVTGHLALNEEEEEAYESA